MTWLKRPRGETSLDGFTIGHGRLRPFDSRSKSAGGNRPRKGLTEGEAACKAGSESSSEGVTGGGGVDRVDLRSGLVKRALLVDEYGPHRAEGDDDAADPGFAESLRGSLAVADRYGLDASECFGFGGVRGQAVDEAEQVAFERPGGGGIEHGDKATVPSEGQPVRDGVDRDLELGDEDPVPLEPG